MQKGSITIFTIICVLALTIVPAITPLVSAASYSVSVLPSRISGNEPTSIIVQVNGGVPSSAYTFRITVTKPSSTGQSSANITIFSSGTGTGTGTVVYPSASFSASSGTVNTDVSGTYTVTVDQVAPTVINGVAATTFTVSFTLSVSIVSPVAAARLARNTIANITANVSHVDSKPDSTASVAVNTLTGSMTLTMTKPGTYTGSYNIQLSDTLGAWNLRVNATDGPNTGVGTVTATVIPATIVVYNLVTRNDAGSPTSVFILGDNMYASFQLGYAGGNYLTTGTYTVQIRSPTGTTIGTMDCTFDPLNGYFIAATPRVVNNNDPDGSWQLAFPSGTVSDQYGNTGPATLSQFKFTVHTMAGDQITTQQWQYIVMAFAALAGGVTAVFALRRFNMTTAPFEELFKRTGGELTAPTTLMIQEDPGTGANTLALQLVSRELSQGRSCGILSYTNFPASVMAKMREMGWDSTVHVQENRLNILDCYSPLAGIEGSPVKDPLDFTEVGMQVSGMIEKYTPPFTLFLDSVTPIFNGGDVKGGVKFLTTLCAKVKSKGGTLILTTIRGSLPESLITQIEAMMDSVIDLGLVKDGRHLKRYLMVKKFSDREVSSSEIGFDIVRGTGIVLKIPRIGFDDFSTFS